MENLLYDLNVAEKEIGDNLSIFFSDSIRKENLLNSVLKKHKVTRSELDASIGWYAGNLGKYNKINTNLRKRYQKSIQELRDAIPKISESTESFSDSAVRPLILDSVAFLNSYNLSRPIFTFGTDTVLFAFGGAFELQFTVLGIDEIHNPELTFCVQCADTAFVKKIPIRNSGFYSETIYITDGKRSKAAYGYIRFPKVNSRTNVLIHNFRLLERRD